MKYIDTMEQVNLVIPEIELADQWYIDTEGTSLDPYSNTLLLLQLRANDVDYVFDMLQLPVKEVLTKLMRGYVSRSITKVFQNAKYDVKVIYHYTKTLPHNIHDTLVTEQVIFAGLDMPFSLDAIAERRTGIVLDKSIRDTFMNHNGVFTERQLEYAVNDIQVLPEIYRQQLNEVHEKELEVIYADEMRLIPAVALMEYTGMPFDSKHMESLIPQFEKAIDTAHKALQDIFIDSGVTEEILFTRNGYVAFNAQSPKHQVLPLMHAVGINLADMNAKTIVQWDYKNKRKAKRYDVDFADLIEDDDLTVVLENYGTLENDYLRTYAFYVALNKLYATYVIGLPELVNIHTGRIHSDFNQARAKTGRFGSKNPNLQNLAKDAKLEALGIKGSIRHAFKCRNENTVLIIADYSGIELVIIADASEDESLIELVKADQVHEAVTWDVLGYKDLTVQNKKQSPHKYWRDGSKKLSYSIAYGVQGKTLSDSLTIELAPIGVKFSEEDGERLIKKWKMRFPKAGIWLDKNAMSVLEYGYVRDSAGRRRTWDTSTFDNRWKRLAAQREASNFPVQSLSATMTKRGIIYTHEGLDLSRARIVSTVHDEIILESSTRYAEEAAMILKKGMERSARELLKHLGELVIVKPEISTRYDK